jgi:hypothetical protein
MKAPKSLTNRRDKLKERLREIQLEIGAIEQAIASLEGHTIIGEDKPPFIRDVK